MEEFRIKFLAKTGLLNGLFARFKEVPNQEKKEVGQALNQLKHKATEKINALKSKNAGGESQSQKEDYTKPREPYILGSKHPNSSVKNSFIEVF
ncbi:hypothetical protein ACQ1PX_11850 [Ornithobacterium rhinotracheale]